MTALSVDDSPLAVEWYERLNWLDAKRRRKLLKTPAMTFAYNATPSGMADQIAEVYGDKFSNAQPPSRRANFYLARKIIQSCQRVLPGPAAVMKHICDLAETRTELGLFLEWQSPTGFPVSNRYQEPKVKEVCLTHDGTRFEYRVAVGALPKINKRKAINAAAPNFVHSLDAAHLIRTVLAAQAEGITDVVTVHDCFACLAPHGFRFQGIIRKELSRMYSQADPLAELHARNVGVAKINPPPRYGTLDPRKVETAHYAFI
jgi:DNA-directed RNA polymerase